LQEVLSGAVQSKDFEHLSAADRKTIGAILVATKRDLPPAFHK
jgi:hypothetical protein